MDISCKFISQNKAFLANKFDHHGRLVGNIIAVIYLWSYEINFWWLMKYSSLGNTGIEISSLGFGLWTLSTKGWGTGNQIQSEYLLREAFDLGLTLFDTSDRYGNGYGEDIIAGLAAGLRHEIIISTKGGYDFYPHEFGEEKTPKNLTYDYLIFACEQSLKRLNTDYIDIYMIDYPTLFDVENDESFEALEKLKENGKILSWGASLDFCEEMNEVGEILIRDRGAQVLHIPHNLLETELLDSLSDLIKKFSTGILARRTHCFGLLDGTLDLKEISALSESTLETLSMGLKRVVTKEHDIANIDYRDGDIRSRALEFGLNDPLVSSVLPNIVDYESLVIYCNLSA